MDRAGFVAFVREQGLAVVATTGARGEPQAALVGVAATDEGQLVFDTSPESRKCANLRARPEVAVVVGGWGAEVTAQGEGVAEEIGRDHPAVAAYLAEFPVRADVAYLLVRLHWVRVSDFTPGTFGSEEMSLV